MAAERQSGAAIRVLAALLSVSLPPLVFRLLSLRDEEIAPGAADAIGALADLSAGLLLVAVLAPFARLSRWLVLPFVGLLALAAWANSETIAALGSLASAADLHFLSDATFVLGSATSVSHPLWLAVVLVTSLALAAIGFGGVGRRPAMLFLVGGCALLAAASLLPGDDAEAWRRENVVQYNLRATLLPPSEEVGSGSSNPAEAMRERLPELAADLDGTPRFAWQGEGRNVLLVILEGVSGAYLETAARAHGRGPSFEMSELDRVFREGVGFATFVDHNRRTNRGLYALLCGELPGLVTGMAKMTAAASRPWRVCLPERLRDAGYRTVYLQAAPLAFMVKDRFMARIGFQEVLGHKWFERYYLRSKWGVDDRAFFEQAADKIRELEEHSKPWFLTLLTVGTHHPYTVPPPYSSANQRRNVRGAFAYLDRAIGEFAQQIEALGIRDDTLILFVSDEAAGDWGHAPDPRAGRLTQNWGFAALLVPERHRALVRDPYAQIDVAATLLDYLGLREQARDFFGRSLLRRYPRQRHLFFGNVNQRSIGGLSPDGRLVDCRFEGHECRVFDATDGRVFASSLAELPPDPALEDLVRDIAQRSRAPQTGRELPIPLLTDPRFRVDLREWQLVLGVSQMALDPDEWIEVDYEVEARGDGRVELDHYLRMRASSDPLHATLRIEPGQTLRVRYTLASNERIAQIGIRTNARLLDGWSVELFHRKRRLVVHRGGPRPPAGVHIERFDLSPAGEAPELVILSPEEIEELARSHTATPDEDEG